MPNSKTVKQFGFFILIGFINTLIDLFILNILMLVTHRTSGAYYIFFKAVSFAVAVVNSYFMNRHWTFRMKKKGRKTEFFEFFTVSLIGLLINVVTASLLVNHILSTTFFASLVWGNIGAITGTAVGLIWNFVGYKYIVFKKINNTDE
jgi:putative flippase GtrA